MNVIKKSLYAVALLFGFHFTASDLESGSRICAQDDVAIEMSENIGTSVGYQQAPQRETQSENNGIGNCCPCDVTCPQVDVSGCEASSCFSSLDCCSQSIEHGRQSVANCGNATSSIVRNCVARAGERFEAMSQGGKKCFVGSVSCLLVTGIIVGALIGTHNMTYNYYHADNLTDKVLKLHYRGNGVNRCTKTVCSTKSNCKTDTNGHKTCSKEKTCRQEVVDCIKTLYQDDRTTIVNYGHLTKLCGRYYKSNSGWEVGSTECVTTKGLKSFDWVLHDHRSRIVFTREAEYYNTTGTAYQYSLDEETSTRMDAEKRCAEEYIHVELNEQNEPILTRRNCYDSVTSAQADKQARDIRLHDSLTSQNLRDKA